MLQKIQYCFVNLLTPLPLDYLELTRVLDTANLKLAPARQLIEKRHPAPV